MNKKFITVLNGEKKEYSIILEFTSNVTGKDYVFYYDDETKVINYAYYKIDGDMYIVEPIESEEEKIMCQNIINDIKNYSKDA